MNTDYSQTQPVPQVKTSGLAIASLILGIIALFTCGCTSLLGLIFGIIALVSIGKSAGLLKGQALAITGVVCSGISMLFTILLSIAIMIPALHGARDAAKQVIPQNNARQICIAISAYCDENDGRLPPADSWPAAITPYLLNDKVLCSPYDLDAGRAYAMNNKLPEKLQDIESPANTVLIFECEYNSPPSGGPELLPAQPGGRMHYVIGFADGHAEKVSPDDIDNLIWTP